MNKPRKFYKIMYGLYLEKIKNMVLTSGLLDKVNGIIPALPQEYVPYPVDDVHPGFVWKSMMFPSSVDTLPFREDIKPVKSGIIPVRRTITKLL